MINRIVFYCNPTGYKVFGLLSLICMIHVYDAEGMQINPPQSLKKTTEKDVVLETEFIQELKS